MTADVTVVIPTHNRCAILSDTLASVLEERQTAIEVVVVDDASDDGTFEWLSSMTDPRVRAIRLDPGKGGSGARNVGLAEATTPYVMFMDDDDLLKRDAISTLVRLLERHPESIGSAGTYVTFGGGRQYRQTSTRIPASVAIWREQVWGWNIQPGAGVFRTPWVRENGGWDESLRRCEDLDFNLRTYPHRVAISPATVVRYRTHPGQVQGPLRQFERELDVEVRRKFVAGLPPRDRALGERTLEARALFAPALYLYEDGDFRGAAAGLREVYRIAPWVTRSPVVGPWLIGILVKATMAMAAPPAVHRTVKRIRVARRTARLDALAES